MNQRAWAPVLAIAMATLACGRVADAGLGSNPADDDAAAGAFGSPASTPVQPFEAGRTAYGFFPSPPEPTLDSVLSHFDRLGEHADFILVQPNIPWQEFEQAGEGESAARQDLRNQVTLASRSGLNWIFVVDPLNGLNRRQFFGLPDGWTPSFADSRVRAAFTNFALWILREFRPAYLGLASEINTYMDAHPDDVEHYLTLYQETYEVLKAESPETQVFVTFQWDDLNNMFAGAAEGRPALETNWDQVEAFEPRLDLRAISTYPYFVFNGGTPIPDDYFTPLMDRTEKPLAIAEGGFSSRPVGPIGAGPADQSAYLSALHDQLGDRLAFWTYLILADLNMDAIGEQMRQQGRGDDVEGLSMFASIGLIQTDGAPKPALALWDSYRGARR